jgi:hypothetical protein
VDTFAFSGPALLCVSVGATVLLIAESGSRDHTSRSSRLLWLLLLLANWPFFDSFALDNWSRSQSLSLALCALLVFLLPVAAKRVWFGLVPILAATISITKVSTGLFVCALLGTYVLLQILQHKMDRTKQNSNPPALRLLLVGLVFSAVGTLLALGYVFFRDELAASNGGISITLNLPEPFATNLAWLTWLQRTIAFVPILVLVIFGFSQFYRAMPVSRRSVPLAITGGIVLSFSLSLFLKSESGVPFLGYVVGTAAVFSSITISSYMPSLALNRRLGLVYLSAVTIFSFAYLLLERTPIQTWATNRAIVAIPLAFVVLVVFLKHQLKSLSLALLTSTVLLCSGVSLCQVVVNRTNGVLALSITNTQWDDHFAQFQGAIAFLESYDKSFTYAVDASPENNYRAADQILYDIHVIMGSTSIQLWADPYFIRQYQLSAEFQTRIHRQYLLTMYPTSNHIREIKRADVSHIILFGEVPRTKWREFLSRQNTESTNDGGSSIVVYEDAAVEVIKL